jgi:dodecin
MAYEQVLPFWDEVRNDVSNTLADAALCAMCPRDDKQEHAMSDHVYKMVELVGSPETSIEDAIQTAIKRASQTLRNLHWFEVVQTRGHIENGEVRHYQVVLKAGFTLEDEAP